MTLQLTYRPPRPKACESPANYYPFIICPDARLGPRQRRNRRHFCALKRRFSRQHMSYAHMARSGVCERFQDFKDSLQRAYNTVILWRLRRVRYLWCGDLSYPTLYPPEIDPPFFLSIFRSRSPLVNRESIYLRFSLIIDAPLARRQNRRRQTKCLQLKQHC